MSFSVAKGTTGFLARVVLGRVEERLGDVGRGHRQAAPVRAPGQLVRPAAGDGVDVAHVVADDEVEGQAFIELLPVGRGERGRFDVLGGVDVAAQPGDVLGVREDAVLELDVDDPIVEGLELLGVIAAFFPEHVGEELHRFARALQAEEAPGGVDVVEGGLHLHGVGVDGDEALALKGDAGEHGVGQVDDLFLGLGVELRVEPGLGHVADDHGAEAARLGIGADQGVDADDAGLGRVVAADAGQGDRRREMSRQGHGRLPRERTRCRGR